MTSEGRARRGRWLVISWLALIASGAFATGAMRTPTLAPWIAPAMYYAHLIAGVAIALLTIGVILSFRPWSTATWIGTAPAASSVALGWLSSQSFAPAAGAAHAMVAAFAAVGVWAVTAERRPAGTAEVASTPVPRWIRVTARAAAVLLGGQVAIGALLRHGLVSLEWHLLAGSAAGLGILAAATAMLQIEDLSSDGRRAAREAAGAVIIQTVLGGAVWLMMLMGPPSAAIWLTLTVAHVVVGTSALLAGVRLAAW